MLKKYTVLAFSVLIATHSFAATKILKVMNDKKRFTISIQEGLRVGDKFHVASKITKKVAQAEVIECKIKSCLAILSNPNSAFELSTETYVLKRKSNTSSSTQYLSSKTGSAGLFIDNSFGTAFGAAAYYHPKKSKYAFGLKFRNISSTISNVKMIGYGLSLEAQRLFWAKSKFKIVGTAEVGMINFDLDLSEIDASQPKIKKSEYFGTLSAEGRYVLSSSFELSAGAGILFNTLKKSYQGQNREYQMEFENFYPFFKAGIEYSF